MSALWTPVLAGVSPGFLRHGPAPPSQVLLHRPLPAVCAGARWSWLDAGSALSLASGRPAPRGAGSTGQGLCVLHEGPPYLEYPHPSSSSTRASRIATRRRRTPPDLPRAASPPLSVGHAAAIGGSVSRPFEGPAPEEDSPLVPGSSLKPRRSRAHPGGTGGVRMGGSRLSLTLECVPRRTREPRRFP